VPPKKKGTMQFAYIVYSPGGDYSFADVEHNGLMDFLKQKGLDIRKEDWDDERVDWKQYQCIILKSPWDYVEKMELFDEWLKKIESLNILLLNPANIVRWNSDKHYLKDIAAANLKVLPTEFLEAGEKFDQQKYFAAFATSKVVVKPCVSGASKNTFVVTRDSTGKIDTINKLLEQEAMMVQPFMPQINDEGEWSFLFFSGEFSHALLKTPASGDFRCQEQFGGSVTRKYPDEKQLAAAKEYVDQFAKGCLYARVDGLMIEGTFYLMELELIDPYLFLDVDKLSYERYYAALCKAT
jgi:glutathione synthase/RimK-type ligase-like ATP-grasp enzyme